MAILHNDLPIPSGLRCCYWSPHHVAQPFCLSSKLSEKEAKLISDFEELKCTEETYQYYADLETNPHTFQVGGFRIEVGVDEKISAVIDAKQAVERYLSSPKKFYFLRTKKAQKGFGLYNIQTSDGRPTKNAQKSIINRSDFLTR